MTVKERIEHAVGFAEHVLFLTDELQAMAITWDAQDTLRCLLTPWNNEDEKKKILEVLKLAFIDWEVEHYILMSEAWMVQIKEKNLKDLPRSLKDVPGRREVMTIQSVTRSEKQMVTFEIVRGDTLKLKKLDAKVTRVEGRMVELLSDRQSLTLGEKLILDSFLEEMPEFGSAMNPSGPH